MDLHLETFKKVADGDEKAYESLFKEFYGFLFSYALGFVQDKHAAEEIVENFFVDLWSNRNKIIITISVKSYFVNSIHNRCLNFLQRKKKQFSLVNDVDSLIGKEGATGENLIEIPTPSILLNELETVLERAIKQLPENCREVFLLSRMDELNYEEISLKKNISINTVKYHIKVALEKLRTSLKDYLPLIFL
jgi:RNA polymerase sigma-70 factor (ECF subfamily)